MADFTIVNWCVGDPCDPCARSPCEGTFLGSEWEHPPDHASAIASWSDYLLCDPAFLLGQAIGLAPADGFANPYISLGSSSEIAMRFASQANSLSGSWDITATFGGATVYSEHTDIHYQNVGDPVGGPWQLVSNAVPSPPPQTISFYTGTVLRTETGWPFPGPIDPADPPYSWRWTITGSFQQIDAPNDITVGSSVYTVTQAFYTLPTFYLFQGGCREYDVNKVPILNSDDVTYPMAASYADAEAALGRTPSRCRPTALTIFVPGSGNFYPTVNPDGSLSPPTLPGSISFDIGPVSYTGTPIPDNPVYGESNPCTWSVEGEDFVGSGATIYLEYLYTIDITTDRSDPKWAIPWPDYLAWFAAPITAATLRRSKMGHRLPLLRRFQSRPRR